MTKTLFLVTTRAGAISLWPVTVQAPGDRQNEWVSTARAAAEEAQTKWIRLYNNDKKSYGFRYADGDWGEPVWPEEDYRTILQVAFRGRPFISDHNHPVVMSLLGRM